MTRLILLALTLLQAASSATSAPGSFAEYRRSVQVAAPGQQCAVLDAATLSHAAPFLKDVRLYASDAAGVYERPYVLTLSEAEGAESEPTRILNLSTRGAVVQFDLAMPGRAYTEIDLDLAGHDFFATADVTGASKPNAAHPTRLGTFDLFDLTSQHLSRDTALHLQESTFPFLRVKLDVSPAGRGAPPPISQMVRAASVPPSREGQILFTTAATSSVIEQQGSDTVVRFSLPQRVPVERVSFALDPAFHSNFSRNVSIYSHPPGASISSGDSARGTIRRVDILAGTREIRDQQLSIPAILGANLQNPAEVEIAINNAGAPPLPISSVQLEMRQRKLCFQAVAGQQLTLYYGDRELSAPAYDVKGTYTAAAPSAIARLGPEELNPAWHTRADARPYAQRHPHLLWVALLIAVCSFALVAIRSSKKHLHRHHHPHQ